MRKDLSWHEAHRWHRRRGKLAYAAAAAILALGATISWSFAMSTSQARFESAEARFQAMVERRPYYLEEAVARYVNVLEVTHGFFEGTNTVTEDEFETFTSYLGFDERLPALTSLQFIRNVPGDEPSYPVVFVAPPTARTGNMGRDLAQDESTASVLEAVGTKEGVAVTPPSLDEWGRPRILLVTPVEQNDEFIGWLGASLDPAKFGAEVLADLPDGARGTLEWANGDELLATVGAEGERFNELHSEMNLEAKGTAWHMTLEGTAAYAPEAVGFPWALFAAGTLPAVFASLILFFLGRSRMRALILAERLARDLAESEARARAVMENAVEAILTADEEGTIETANPAAGNLFGWGAQDLVGRKITTVLPSLAGGQDGVKLGETNWGSKEQTLDAHRRDGTWVPVDVSLSPTSFGAKAMYVLVARDATMRKLYEDQLEHQATHDALTGLANRKLFEELLMRAVFRGDRSHQPLAVLFVDLDGFKEINDDFGHPMGDRVLAETARRLESVVRPGDVVARLGGDEFAVLCENLSAVSDAEKIAGRIVAAVAEPIPVASGIAVVTASVGVALADDGEGAASLVSRADHAMYEMKNQGKAGYRLAPTGTG